MAQSAAVCVCQTHVEEQKSKTENKTEETVPSAIVDTTDQHRAHLFDLNCKICTGKMLPPASQETTKVKVSCHSLTGHFAVRGSQFYTLVHTDIVRVSERVSK